MALKLGDRFRAFDISMTERYPRYKLVSAVAIISGLLVIIFIVTVLVPSSRKVDDTDISESVNIWNDGKTPMEWREHILRGVSVLPQFGTPGRIVVFGKQAEPILTGTNAEDVLVAAAEFGKGRIVTISQTGYSDKFSKEHGGALKEFHDNLKKWLTKGTFQKNDTIIDAKDNANKEKLRSVKIVVYHGGQVKIDQADLTEFVRNGGALLHCETPWVWVHYNRVKSLSDAPYATLLSEAGLCYTDEYISVNATCFSVKDNKASGAHLLRILDESGKNFSKAVNHVNMLKRLKYVPAKELLKLRSFVDKLWDTCNEELNNNCTIPSPKTQVTKKREFDILGLWLLSFDLAKPRNTKAPGVNVFPGDFSTAPPLKAHTVEYHSNLSDFHSTGCYLPAGQTLKVDVLSGNEGHDWELLIGCHTDELRKDELRRWPKVSKKVRLVEKTLEILTPFGGLIYLISPGKAGQGISVKLENVVDAPRFRLAEGENGRAPWIRRRNSPGLWADIEGEYAAFTLPASSVKELGFDALTSVTKFWDSVVRLSHNLRGTDVSKFRRMWIVTDEQPSAGYMHSGYPIVTHLDVADPKRTGFLLNGTVLQKEGSWGVFHEIGHNMQRGEWTFDGTGEVTCNIFVLYAMDEICRLKPWIHSWLRGQLNDAKTFLNNGTDFQARQRGAGIGLLIYAQLAHEFGWESYRKVFRDYEAMPDKDKPKTDQQKIDKWYSLFSETAGMNLAPLAIFWDIPLSVETDARLRTAFPVGFLPDDEVTRFAPNRVQAVLRKFPGTARNRTRRYVAKSSILIPDFALLIVTVIVNGLSLWL